MKTYKAPKGIANHPGVEECDCGIENGTDYKHDVFLKKDWAFSRGRMEGIRSGFFNSVKEFLAAEPKKRI